MKAKSQWQPGEDVGGCPSTIWLNHVQKDADTLSVYTLCKSETARVTHNVTVHSESTMMIMIRHNKPAQIQ